MVMTRGSHHEPDATKSENWNDEEYAFYLFELGLWVFIILFLFLFLFLWMTWHLIT
jgi:hypothetical protein